MTPDEYEAMKAKREERRARLQEMMSRCVADVEELHRLRELHPTPWTWGMAFHDGWFIQFFDAHGKPCLGDDLREPEDAAFLLHMVNTK